MQRLNCSEDEARAWLLARRDDGTVPHFADVRGLVLPHLAAIQAHDPFLASGDYSWEPVPSPTLRRADLDLALELVRASDASSPRRGRVGAPRSEAYMAHVEALQARHAAEPFASEREAIEFLVARRVAESTARDWVRSELEGLPRKSAASSRGTRRAGA